MVSALQRFRAARLPVQRTGSRGATPADAEVIALDEASRRLGCPIGLLIDGTRQFLLSHLQADPSGTVYFVWATVRFEYPGFLARISRPQQAPGAVAPQPPSA